MSLSVNQKGAIAELRIAEAAVRAGITVLAPAVEHMRYDLALEIGGTFWRTQCKWGALDRDRGVVKVRVSSSRSTPAGHLHRTYTAEEVDLLAVHCGELERSYLLPVERIAGRRTVWLRLEPPRNGQRACVTLAEDFAFDGAVAQLAERCRGTAEARGSNPLSSTDRAPTTVGAHEFRNRFGWYTERAAAGEDIVVRRHGRPHVRLTAAG